MKITSTTLRAIADKLDALEKIDADITGFRLHGLSVTVRSSSDQMDGRTIYVTRITEHAGLRNREVTQPARRTRRELDPLGEFDEDDEAPGANDPELQ